MARSRFWAIVGAWTVTISALSTGFATLNPTHLLAPYLSGPGRAIVFVEGIFSGLISGAFLGFVLGLVAATVRVVFARFFDDPGATRTERPAKPFLARPPAIAFMIGLAISAVTLASSPMWASLATSNTACSAAATGLTDAGKLGSNHLFQDAVNQANEVIANANDCQDGSRTDYLGQAYFIKAASENRMQQDYAADAKLAETNLQDCVTVNVGEAKSECSTLLESAHRYVAQHFCQESFQDSLQAEAVVEKFPDQALTLSNAALKAAGQCQNAYAYANRGIALMEHNVAAYLSGNRKIDEFRESRTLLSRCISELSGATHDQDVLANCKSGLDADNTWLAKLDQ